MKSGEEEIEEQGAGRIDTEYEQNTNWLMK